MAALLRRHIAELAPPYVRVRLRFGRGTRPYRVVVSHPLVRAAVRACTRGFAASPVLLPMGGSIAAIPLLEDVLAIPSVLVGFALPGDGKHGPNERFHLPTFRRAIATSILFLEECAAAPSPASGIRRAVHPLAKEIA